VTRLYFGCHHFGTFDQIFFLVLLLSMIFQAMCYNGLIDIPALFSIIILASLFAFRKNFPNAYRAYSALVAHFLVITATLKIFCQLVINIKIIDKYLEEMPTYY
jgi:hypothetical protein